MADENTPDEGEQNDNAEQSDEKSDEAQASESSKPTEVPPEMKRALSKANKEAEQLRLKLREFEERDKTEAQKLSDRAEAAEKRAADLETRSLRLEVASEQGLTSAQAKRLVGSTREELEADAVELLETFKVAAPLSPKPDPSQGARSTSKSSSAAAGQAEADRRFGRPAEQKQ